MWGDLGNLIVAKGFKKLPNVQKIAQSGHTAPTPTLMAFTGVTNAHGPRSHQPTVCGPNLQS